MAARILVLEDDDELRDVLVEILDDEGYQVTAVGRGEDAVQQAQAEAFDLIVADIRMEGMDGLEALEKTQKLQPGIGSLIVSGYATERETSRAEALDVGAYIRKPFKMDSLLGHIRTELARRKRQEKSLESSDFYRQALDWSLNSLTQVIDQSGLTEGSLQTAGETAEAVCRTLGLDVEVCLSARWATILWGGRSWPDLELPEFFQSKNEAVPLLADILKALDESPEDLNKEVQAVHLSLQAHFPESLAGESDWAYSPEVSEAFDTCVEQPERTEQLPLEVRLGLKREETRQRSLVSLAFALERLGDAENASKAYGNLSGDDIPEKERLEGLLGLARLARSNGDQNGCHENCRRVLALAESRGPTSLSVVGLEAALLLQQGGDGQAGEALKKVARAARATSFDEGVALVRCAVAQLEGRELERQHVAALLDPSGGGRIGRYVNWLIQHLFGRLESTPDPVLAEVLGKVVSDYGPRFLFWFDSVRCDSKVRFAVTTALKTVKRLPQPILDALLSAPEAEIRDIGNLLKSRSSGKVIQLLKVQSFGQPMLLTQGEPVEESNWKTRKIKYLFFLLASDWGKPVVEDHIMEAFWPKDQTRNKKNLYWATSNLRKLLKTLVPQTETPLLREHDTLSLNPEIPRWHDLEEFQKAADQGLALSKAGDNEGSLKLLRLAAQVYTGPYLDGCFHDFAVELKSQTEETALEVNLTASELLLAGDDDLAALEHAVNAVEIAPYRQDARALCMRAQIRVGQAAQAIDQFREIEKILKEDYELEPATELLELFHRARLGYTDA
jgi:DNA-binding response OmpR family regulator/DNA-binding SARP family transcriptional activator